MKYSLFIIGLFLFYIAQADEVTSDVERSEAVSENLEMAQKSCQNYYALLTHTIRIPTVEEMKKKQNGKFDQKKYDRDLKYAKQRNESAAEYQNKVKDIWGGQDQWVRDCARGYSYGKAQSEKFTKGMFKQGKNPDYEAARAFCDKQFPHGSKNELTKPQEKIFISSVGCVNGLYSYTSQIRKEAQSNMSNIEITDKYCADEVSRKDRVFTDVSLDDCKKGFMAGISKSKELVASVNQKSGFNKEYLFRENCTSCNLFDKSADHCAERFPKEYALQSYCIDGARTYDPSGFGTPWFRNYDPFF